MSTNWAWSTFPKSNRCTTVAASHREITEGGRKYVVNRPAPRSRRVGNGSTEPIRRRKESTTVDIGDCQHADSDQRQLMADAVLGGRRHGQKSSRGSGPTLIGYLVSNQAMTTSTSSAMSANVTRDRGITVHPSS
ncbi:hypothetical protein CH256_12325 [Rhodococcus sp. 05-2254-6]|nr:hypothetical protein CH256_12325 [Rhodococcus sp. 05-2254-6]